MCRKVFWFACIVGSIVMINGCSKLSNAILPKNRPLLVCGKQDDNGDGKINIDDGATGLFAVRINSDKVQFDRLTDPDLEYQKVLVSPTGEHIAYRATTRDTNGDGKANVFGDAGYGIYIADLDLDNPEEIVYADLESDIQRVEWFTWSRDGSQLSISTMLKSGVNEVWVISVDGLEKQRLSFDEYVSKAGKNFSWVFSPDGNRQLLPLEEGGWVLADASANISNAGQYPLLTDQIPDSWWAPISWSPDGEHILLKVSEGPLTIESKIDQSQLITEITVEPNSKYSLYSIDREGNDLIRLGPIGVGTLLNYAAWSPNGNQLAFLSEWEDTNGDDLVDSESKHKLLLYLVNLDGSQVRILLRGEDGELWLGSCLSW